MSTVTQHDWLRRVSDYHSGDVDEAEAIAVEEHLAHCAECRQALSMYHRLYALAQSPLRLGPPSSAIAERLSHLDSMPARFVDDADKHEHRAHRPRRRSLQPPQNRLKVTIAALLAASLIIGGFLALLGPHIQTPANRPTPNPSVPPTLPTPTLNLAGLSVYVNDRLGWYVLNAEDGATRRTAANEGLQGPALVLADGTVYSVTFGQLNEVRATKVSDGTLLWQHSVPQMDSPHLVVNGDSIYLVTDSVGAASTSNNHGIYALRISDGKLRWHYPTVDPVVAAPLVADGVVYASAGTSLLALNASDGTLLWRLPLAANGRPDIGLWLSGANGIVYVIAGEKSQDLPLSISGDNASLFALRGSDGRQLWRVDLGSDYYTQPSAPVIVDGVIYVRAGASRADRARGDTTSAHLYALRASDGMLLWQYQETGPSTTPAAIDPQIFQPVFADGWVYSYDRFGNVIALRASDGQLIWKRQISSRDGIAGLSVGGGALFVSVNGAIMQGSTGGIPQPNLLFALRAGDGKTLWQRVIGADGGGGMSAPIVTP
ncbi:MAG: outer membrane protein assembly factor BamB family protein [Ktedonobacterales bacterium]